MIMHQWKASGEPSKVNLSIIAGMQPDSRLYKDITEYIEVFYNRQRIQERLGYLPPVVFEQKYYEEQQLAA